MGIRGREEAGQGNSVKYTWYKIDMGEPEGREDPKLRVRACEGKGICVVCV